VGRDILPTAKDFMKRHEFISFIFLALIMILMVLLATSCSLVNQKLDYNKVYRRDIKLEVNGETFDGVAVPSRSISYRIKMQAYGKIDTLIVKSCSRDVQLSKPSSGVFSSKKKYVYVYEPLQGLEDSASCALEIGAYEEKKGRHGWANIYFQDKKHSLFAELKCGGKHSFEVTKSASVCQGSVGSFQKISFQERVKVSPIREDCKIMQTKDELNYEYIMPRGECVFYFGSKSGDFHTHTTFGFEEILVRGN